MKVGVIDTNGKFEHLFFKDKKIAIMSSTKNYEPLSLKHKYSHGEYVCACILKQNPKIEIILYGIASNSKKNIGKELKDSLIALMEQKVSIINISLGIESSCEEFKEIIEVVSKNIIIIASHSNNKTITYPACYNNVISVQANDFINQDKQKLFWYNKLEKTFIFQYNYTSCFQLGETILLPGNSFLTATITGILSNLELPKQYSELCEYIKKLEEQSVNRIIPKNFIYNKSCVVVLDKITNELLKFYSTYLYNSQLIRLNKLLKQDSKEEKDKILYIDLNDYAYCKRHKDAIEELVSKRGSNYAHVLFRYPFFNYLQRIEFYCKNKILIEQNFL